MLLYCWLLGETISVSKKNNRKLEKNSRESASDQVDVRTILNTNVIALYQLLHLINVKRHICWLSFEKIHILVIDNNKKKIK